MDTNCSIDTREEKTAHSITSSAREQRRRHVEAEYPAGLGVDDQLELG
jgi:hypothetical protein